jgi:DNA-directed RNA polymerase subunit RPC12/RpoP
MRATMIDLSGKQTFPCLVCASPLLVKQTEKAKPYLVCDPCGIQVFVRGPGGIAAFNRLVERGIREDVWARIKEMEPRYRLKCPKCGHRFWIEPSLVKTSMFDGTLQGFRCPGENCGATVPWEKKV